MAKAKRAGRVDAKGNEPRAKSVPTDPESDGSRSGKEVADQRGTYGTVDAILERGSPITVQAVREGLAVVVVETLAGRLGVTSTTLQRWLSLSKQTYARRRKQGRLTAPESDRVVRYAELLRRATEFLGDGDAATRWLNTPAAAFGGEAPLEHATTEFGAREVWKLIGRLEHGIPT